MYGMARRQLMQEYAQKSTTTTLPRSASRVSGLGFSQPVAPSRGGSGPSVWAGPSAPAAAIMAPPCGGFAALIIIDGAPSRDIDGAPSRDMAGAALLAGVAGFADIVI